MRYLCLKMVIILFSVLALCLASGCGLNGSSGRAGADGESCLVETLDDGVYISCPRSDAFIPHTSEDSGSEDDDSDDSDDVVVCKRGKGHTKHKHHDHEPCDDD